MRGINWKQSALPTGSADCLMSLPRFAKVWMQLRLCHSERSEESRFIPELAYGNEILPAPAVRGRCRRFAPQNDISQFCIQTPCKSGASVAGAMTYNLIP